MDTELTFLLTLLLEHKLTQPTKKLITERIKVVEAQYNAQPQQPVKRIAPSGPVQSPSTQAMLDRDGPITTPQIVAQTPETAQALVKRQQVIQAAANADPFGSKPEPGRTSPRKF